MATDDSRTASDQLLLGLDASRAIIELLRYHVEAADFIQEVERAGHRLKVKLPPEGVTWPTDVTSDHIAKVLYDLYSRLTDLHAVVARHQLRGAVIE